MDLVLTGLVILTLGLALLLIRAWSRARVPESMWRPVKLAIVDSHGKSHASVIVLPGCIRESGVDGQPSRLTSLTIDLRTGRSSTTWSI